jgi:hypothetical protein
MEAAVAEKEAGMTEWNDARLDDLSDRVDRIEKKMDAGFARMDAKFDAFGERLDKLQHLLTQTAWTYRIGMLAFGGALLGLIAAKF